MKRLEGKVIVLAGSGAIGGACARRFASEGATVVVGDRNEDVAAASAEELNAAGGRAVSQHLDGTSAESIQSLVDRAVTDFGGIDGFHANYASFVDGTISVDVLQLPMETWDEEMEVDARGFVLCTKAAIPALLARGGGSMVYTSSGAAYEVAPIRVAYSMAKASILALMRHVATRFGPQNIRANVIAPGLVMHPRLEKKFDEATKKAFMRSNMFKDRLGEPDDIAAMAAFLMSPDARYVTAQVMCVDGGATSRA
ncbi:MAG: SDR family oxidoreductase [Novosphingobium sp.]|nr:SDR family oxidoreductase [Novosphingobium sp.]